MSHSPSDEILNEQLAYYNARAQEYDESVQGVEGPDDPAVSREWQHIVAAVHDLPPGQRVLELACGTGIWTQELLAAADSIVALDGAPEMLEVNRAKLGSPKVSYQPADLFHWKADATYDLVFFAFWLSHVPEDHLDQFLAEVSHSVRPGGRVFLIDEPAGGKQVSGPEENNQQTRQLHDGSAFRIVKVYYDPRKIAEKLRKLGFSEIESWVGDYFFYSNGVRQE
jgi:demethylmenaquinone methyltransferase/2-methoxy-6-polyprenyl-1,4-benzoquinol methylase